ncbi:hypothetical protein L914_14031 [Phytophthora nicotianae]|uniref:Uncharacterized protein n=1 Tax=Phytophthora nicotianae TaxID=4792 RepID=W2MWN9_PHYNI|nr:hypothetical protein L914_14031 [Phytophthora nicotianae]
MSARRKSVEISLKYEAIDWIASEGGGAPRTTFTSVDGGFLHLVIASGGVTGSISWLSMGLGDAWLVAGGSHC